GQRQRISIARALIKDAPIILLDEPTSALDTESEHQVAEAMARLCKGRTTLAIAHRLHTVVNAHRIHVVECGLVVETGTHHELIEVGRRYASFYRTQFRFGAAGQTVDPEEARRSVSTEVDHPPHLVIH